MSLDSVLAINITKETATPTQPGFGTPLILAYHTLDAVTRVREYASATALASMVSDGFTTSHPAYLAASLILQANPRPPKLKIGRIATAPTWTYTLKVLSATVGVKYSVKVNETQVDYTVANPTVSGSPTYTYAEVGLTGDTITRSAGSFIDDGIVPGMLATSSGSVSNNFSGQLITAVTATELTLDTQDLVAEVGVASTLTFTSTVASIAYKLEALVEAVDGITSTQATDTVTLSGAAGTAVRLRDWSNNMSVACTSTDPGLAADLAAIELEDNDWYGLCSAAPASKACIQAAAAWVETAKRIYAQHTNDTACGDNSSTTDVMYAEKALAHALTYLQYQGSDTMAYAGAAMLGSRLPATPGSDTWHLKTQPGIPVENRRTLTPTQQSAILAKNGNVYVTLAGLNKTLGGVSPSGEFMDVGRFLHWLEATMQIRIYGYLATQEKVPYTDIGIESLANVARGVLQDGIDAGGLTSNPAPTVTAELADEQSTSDRGNRVYNGLSFDGRLAGAIHKGTVSGKIGV